MQRLEFEAADGSRFVLLHRPPGQQLPLLLMLHGTGGTAQFAADETRWPEFADRHGFAVAYPDGLPVNPNEPVRFLTNPQRWNDGSTKPGQTFHATTDDVGFLAASISRLTIDFDLDPDRVAMIGFSNGAGMAFRFAAERPELLSCVIPVAGYCHVVPLPNSLRVPTLFMIGSDDWLIPIDGGPVRVPWHPEPIQRPPIAESLERWASALGCSPNLELISEIDGIREAIYPGPVPFEVCTVAGLGHHWPGGLAKFNPRIAGPSSDRLDGRDRAWKFIANKRRSR